MCKPRCNLRSTDFGNPGTGTRGQEPGDRTRGQEPGDRRNVPRYRPIFSCQVLRRPNNPVNFPLTRSFSAPYPNQIISPKFADHYPAPAHTCSMIDAQSTIAPSPQSLSPESLNPAFRSTVLRFPIPYWLVATGYRSSRTITPTPMLPDPPPHTPRPHPPCRFAQLRNL